MHEENDSKTKVNEASVMYRLSARQIEEFDNIYADKQAERMVLNIAMTRATNRLSELEKAEKEWWATISDQFELNLIEHDYTLDRVAGAVVLITTERAAELRAERNKNKRHKDLTL